MDFTEQRARPADQPQHRTAYIDGQRACDIEGCWKAARYVVGGGAAATFRYCEGHAVNLCACEGYYLAPGVDIIPDDGMNGEHTRDACRVDAETGYTRSPGTPGGSLMRSLARGVACDFSGCTAERATRAVDHGAGGAWYYCERHGECSCGEYQVERGGCFWDHETRHGAERCAKAGYGGCPDEPVEVQPSPAMRRAANALERGCS